MAVRPLFMPIQNRIGVNEKNIDFNWHSGFSASQKQKSIQEFHSSAFKLGIEPILEISTKSLNPHGIALSAFNLIITTKKNGMKFSVECAFQGSKVFEKGGPYTDLLKSNSISAKRDERLRSSGSLLGFRFFGKDFSLTPLTFFYDWIYINALAEIPTLSAAVTQYGAFSDIEFNHKKSINCQARSAALYCSLKSNKKLELALASPDDFMEICKNHYQEESGANKIQNSLF